MLAQCFQLPRGWRKVFAIALMLALHLALQTLAASEALHHCLHEDAHAPEHQCVIKLFADGKLLGAEAPPEAIRPCLISFVPPERPAMFRVGGDCLLPHGRAPPVLPA